MAFIRTSLIQRGKNGQRTANFARKVATTLKILLCVLLIVINSTDVYADVIEWPTDTGWDPITVGGNILPDVQGDLGWLGNWLTPHLDLVGGNDGSGTEFASSYLNLIDLGGTQNPVDQLAIRLRIGDIRNRRMSGSYQVLFNTDNSLMANYALMLSVNDLDNNQGTIQLVPVTGSTPGNLQYGVAVWEGAFADHARWTGTPTSDGSQFGGDDDFFLDFGIGWDVFSQNTGVSEGDPFQAVVATSIADGIMLLGDLGGTEEYRQFTFSDEIYSDNIPEPAVVTLVLAFGGGMIAVRRIFGR